MNEAICLLAARVLDKDDPFDQYKRKIDGRIVALCMACNASVFLSPASQAVMRERPNSIVRCLQCGPNPQVKVVATTDAHIAEQKEYERKTRARKLGSKD